MKKVAADVSKAKAHEAYINYKADKKVARAVAHAMKHSGGHLEKSLAQAALPGIGGVAVAGAALAGLESAHISGEHWTPLKACKKLLPQLMCGLWPWWRTPPNRGGRHVPSGLLQNCIITRLKAALECIDQLFLQRLRVYCDVMRR